jgi:hypothetical protein
MTDSPSDARSVTLSTRFYQALLRTYPAAFRAEYAEPMAQLFRDNCQRANRQGGMAAVLILWAHTLADYARTTLEEYADGGIQMTRSTFVKLSGWALPVGAVSLIVGFLASNRPEYNPQNMSSLPVDRLANTADTFLIVFGFLLCAMGMVGLLVRYGGAAGRWARFGLGAGAVSALVAAVGVVIGAVNPDAQVAWPMFFLGMTFMFIGLLVFGLACIRRKPLPRWNALPLLAAMWLPSVVLLSAMYGAVTGDWPEASAVNGMLLALASFGGLALLGLVMLTDDRAPASQTPVL